ncbi:MAG: hypothetical protein KDC98_26555 [Planctomycetes bacterium]|nr:hypothetical protein [Planctomycetota bacterium]
MSHFTADRLWQLLPSIYRIRDEGTGELRALIEVIAEQARRVEADIDQLHDDLFIETCAEWVVPYIGDLLGVTNLHGFVDTAAFSQRGRVANTLAYRRRKGTAPMLEQLAFDTTGWRSRAVEFFLRLDTTQHLNHVRGDHVRTLDLRDSGALELIGGAFDPAAYGVDVRPIAAGAARPNIPNVGLFLWRLAACPIVRSEARPHAAPTEGRYTFDPLGLDLPLFNRPQAESEITQLASELNVPARLRRRPLYDELEARRQVMAENLVLGGERTVTYAWFDDRVDAANPPVLQVFLDEDHVAAGGGSFVAIPAEEIMICDLSAWDEAGWTAPSGSKSYTVEFADGTTLAVPMPIRAYVDPELGRVAFPAAVVPTIVHVSYAYGLAGDLGAGPYQRDVDAGLELDGWVAAVGREASFAHLGVASNGTTRFLSIADAVVAWNAQTINATGYIVLLDNSAQNDDLLGPSTIELGEGRRLTILAAEWAGIADGLPVERAERRALLGGTIEVVGTAAAGSAAPGELRFDGVLIEQPVLVRAGNLGGLEFVDSTLVEGVEVDSSVAGSDNDGLSLSLRRTITAPLIASNVIRSIAVADSVVHGRSLLAAGASGPGVSIAGDLGATVSGPALSLERTTVFGRVFVERLDASETIFREVVVVERLQQGCVRFSFVPPRRLGAESRTPRRFRCQPGLAIEARARELGVERSALSPDEVARVIAATVPMFTSTRFGDPGFAQLARACAVEIRTGAEDGSEMGVWSLLKNPQRIANLQASLDEYLRLGLESGFVFVT